MRLGYYQLIYNKLSKFMKLKLYGVYIMYTYHQLSKFNVYVYVHCTLCIQVWLHFLFSYLFILVFRYKSVLRILS